MSGLARRLTKLEATSGPTEQTMVVFVSLVPGPDLHETATVDGRVWHREPDESEEAFLDSVVTQARRPGNRVLVVILDHLVAPPPESRSEAAEASAPRLGLPSFVNVELMG